MSQKLQPIPLQQTIQAPGVIKQIIESRSHNLEVVREALSNACAPEVGAKVVKIQFYLHPEYGSTFIFKDDGSGMDYTGDANHPGRLDKFFNVGFAAVSGFQSDKYGWKGLGSKLMLNCRRLEVQTWTGRQEDPVYKLEVLEPRAKLLCEIPTFPVSYLTPRKAESTDTKGTVITVYGYEGGQTNYTFEKLRDYVYWNTIVGFTRDDISLLPKVFLRVGNDEQELPIGYPYLRKPDSSSLDCWKTVIVDPPVVIKETTNSGESLEVVLKGGFTLNTSNACKWGFSLSRTIENTGLRLSVLGIPCFRLDFHKLKGDKFQQYLDLSSFVTECDNLWSKLNIDRSNYNKDDPVVQTFERAVKKAFDAFAQRREYTQYVEFRHREDEKSKSTELTRRKTALESTEQKYVCVKDASGNLRVLHRVPENEHDTCALFWKLEGANLIPLTRFLTLEHTNQKGMDAIATFQVSEDSQLKIMEAVEFEPYFERFEIQGHNPKQTSLVICWEVRKPEALQKVNDWNYRAIIGSDVVSVLVIKNFPKIEIHPRSEIELLY